MRHGRSTPRLPIHSLLVGLALAPLLFVAARGQDPVFESRLRFSVNRYVPLEAGRKLGTTPSKVGVGVSVPRNEIWYVTPFQKVPIADVLRECLRTKACGLDLSYRVESLDLGLLPAQRHLRYLGLDGGWLFFPAPSLEQVRAAGNLTNLEVLRVGLGTAGKEGLASLSRLLNLRHLYISGAVGLAPELAELLPELPHLTVLSLSWSEIDDAVVAACAKASKVVMLELMDTHWGRISDKGLGPIRQLEDLRHLRVRSRNVSDFHLWIFPALVHLEHCDLGGCSISGWGLEAMTSLPKLRA